VQWFEERETAAKRGGFPSFDHVQACSDLQVAQDRVVSAGRRAGVVITRDPNSTGLLFNRITGSRHDFAGRAD
jgi:hypothetical protein